MTRERDNDACYVAIEDVRHVERQPRRRQFGAEEEVADPWSYRAKRGLGTLRLTLVEYRILAFLAAQPNQAFTQRHIAEAVSTKYQSVTAETLGKHIHSLRGRLGFYSDYIQSVPHIGYRFKA